MQSITKQHRFNDNVMPATNEQLLADIRQLAPDITKRVPEIEAVRRMPPDLVESLREIGTYRMFVPRSHGGLELDLRAGLDVIETLAKVDASVGWTVMIGSGGALFSPLLTREIYDQIYKNGPDVVMAGSTQPIGKAEKVADGWRINGRWPFASGCHQADWMMGLCVMTENGKPLPGPAGAGGPPLIRGVVLPAQDWRIEDTWYVAGLKGTGSDHIVLKDASAPDANFIELGVSVPCVPGVLYPGVQALLPLLHGAFAVGVARGALDDLVALARTGRQQLRAAVPMRDSELFQSEIGRAEADVRAARAALRAQIDSHWRHALAGTLTDPARVIEATQTAIWIATTCVRAVDTCFALAGGSAVYDSSPLQRRLRDTHVAAQHAAVHQRHYVNAGKLLLETSGLPNG